MADKTVYFISGVSGVGKTSVRKHLEELLPDGFEVRDFDERGVPSDADHEWRKAETKHWIQIGTQKWKEGKTLVVCGIANPDEIDELKKDLPNMHVEVILLDADDDVIEQRLRSRNEDKNVREKLERVVTSVETFIQDNRNFTPVLREICKKHNCSIIDTTYLAPKEAAKQAAESID